MRRWWGEGTAPHLRWPGVTVPIDDGGGRYYYDAVAAELACGFFPKYASHSKGPFAGQPFALLNYQRDLILRPLFGWKRKSDDARRFQKAYLEIPKKNGKTQLIAGLGLYMLLCDGEPGAEVYCAAADRGQAGILFNAAKAMVDANKKLSSRVQAYRNSIVRSDDPTAFFQVLSADADTKHGFNIHCLVIDELHAQPDRDLFEALTRGVISRRQPLTLFITTAGDDDESICHEEYERAKRILDGTESLTDYLPVVFEAGPDDDWQDPDVWARVNPGLGTTIPVSNFEALAKEAAAEPRKRNSFLQLNLNRWVNQAVAWIPIEWWDACEGPVGDADIVVLPCAAGLDLAQKWDLAAFVVVFKRMLERSAEASTIEVVATEGEQAVKRSISLNYRLVVVPFFWIPEDTARQHEREDGVPYRLWAEQGLVTLTEGAVIDYDRIYRDITEKIVPRFPKLKQGEIGYDPAFATDLATKLRDKGGLKVVEVLQNYKHLSEPSQVFEALVKGKRVTHDGHRLLHWNMGNVAVKQDDAGRIRPVKPKKNSTKRIDGPVATIMGVGRVNAMPEPPPKQSYAVEWVG